MYCAKIRGVSKPMKPTVKTDPLPILLSIFSSNTNHVTVMDVLYMKVYVLQQFLYFFFVNDEYESPTDCQPMPSVIQENSSKFLAAVSLLANFNQLG